MLDFEENNHLSKIYGSVFLVYTRVYIKVAASGFCM